MSADEGKIVSIAAGCQLSFIDITSSHLLSSPPMDELIVKKLVPHAHAPEKATEGDLGFDLFCSHSTTIAPGQTIAVPTGIALQFPQGWGAVIKDRSSMALKQIHISAGVIDNGYRGEIKVAMTNHSKEETVIDAGQKMAQLIPVPVTNWVVRVAEKLSATRRGHGGFGSTGSHGPRK
ncbi:MAG: dUTP diphosphatase [Nitrospinota bacterium]|nr:dUTP diphosphatase [Nitrospinota bacterium]